MEIHHIGSSNSILNTFITEIRDENIQKDAMRFRRNIERIGEVLGYELSKKLSYSDVYTNTPLGKKKGQLPTNEIVLCSVLRAGLPLHQGVLNYFDGVENACAFNPVNGIAGIPTISFGATNFTGLSAA